MALAWVYRLRCQRSPTLTTSRRPTWPSTGWLCPTPCITPWSTAGWTVGKLQVPPTPHLCLDCGSVLHLTCGSLLHLTCGSVLPLICGSLLPLICGSLLALIRKNFHPAPISWVCSAPQLLLSPASIPLKALTCTSPVALSCTNPLALSCTHPVALFLLLHPPLHPAHLTYDILSHLTSTSPLPHI